MCTGSFSSGSLHDLMVWTNTSRDLVCMHKNVKGNEFGHVGVHNEVSSGNVLY